MLENEVSIDLPTLNKNEMKSRKHVGPTETRMNSTNIGFEEQNCLFFLKLKWDDLGLAFHLVMHDEYKGNVQEQ